MVSAEKLLQYTRRAIVAMKHWEILWTTRDISDYCYWIVDYKNGHNTVNIAREHYQVIFVISDYQNGHTDIDPWLGDTDDLGSENTRSLWPTGDNDISCNKTMRHSIQFWLLHFVTLNTSLNGSKVSQAWQAAFYFVHPRFAPSGGAYWWITDQDQVGGAQTCHMSSLLHVTKLWHFRNIIWKCHESNMLLWHE